MLSLAKIKQWFNHKEPVTHPEVAMKAPAVTVGNTVSTGLLRQVSRLNRLYQVANPDQAIEDEIVKYYVRIFNETGHALTTLEKTEAYLKQITQE